MGKSKDHQNKAILKESEVDLVKGKPGKGRDTMFRAVYMNQVNQNQIADNKASILIGINTTIISALLAITAYSSDSGILDDENGLYFLPVISLLLTCLVSVIFALLSARPKVVSNSKSLSQKSSLLFFGVMASYSQEEYIRELDQLLQRGEEVYRHMAIDIYNQGILLRRKFNLLSYSYQAFLLGFVASVVIFLVLLLAA